MRRRATCFLFAVIALAATTASLAEGVTLPDARRVVLDNGAVLILTEKKEVPLIGLRTIVRGGGVADPASKAGLGSLYAELIQKGAGARDAAAFAEAIDSAGGRLTASAELEHMTISGDFLARDATLMIELLADMLMRPTLDRDEFAKLRDRAVNLLLAAKDSDPAPLMPVYAHAFLFGSHPYGNPVGGDESSLAEIRHEDVSSYFEQQVGSDRLVISVAGDFETDVMQALLTDAFGDWRPAAVPLAAVDAPAKAAGGQVLLIDKPGATQTYFWAGNRGVAVDYPQRAALDLANTVFGGRFTSMLNQALRVESGLTYGARSQLVRPSQAGSVGISSFTAKETTVEALDMALDVLTRFRQQGIAAEVLESAQNYVLGQFPTRLETATQVAAQLAALEAAGLPRSYVDGYGDAIRSVTMDSALAVIDEVYPSRDELVFVLLGDAASIRDAVTGYGTVIEMSITAPSFRPAETD